MSQGGGRRAVAAALGANLAIAAAKLVGFGVTGSSSLLAESAHSLADSGNQLLLIVGARRSARPPDADHPFGYGRDRYFYAFVVALVLFSGGALFALFEGAGKVRHPHPLTSPPVALLVVGFALLAEGFSFRTAVRSARAERGDQSWAAYLRGAKSPELPVVLLEDTAALLGLVLALAGIGLTVLTGDAVWDGIGTLLIGVLLGVVAALLAGRMKQLLIGETASAEAVGRIGAALRDGVTVLRVIHLKTTHLGPDHILVAAKVAMAPGLTLPEVARAIDAAEARVRAVEPLARTMYLEPDLDRG